MKKGIIGFLSATLGVAVGVVAWRLLERRADVEAEKIEKFKGYYNMLNQWLRCRQEGKTLESFFVENDYQTIAIYGMGEMGNRLYDELKDSSKVEIKYVVDRNAAGVYAEIDILEPEDSMLEVDVIVVTATFAFEEIAEKLSKKVECPIISLDEVVYEL